MYVINNYFHIISSGWNFYSHKTWLGIAEGGVGGALKSVATNTAITTTAGIGFAVGRIFLTATAHSKGWDFTSPEVWNSVFQGFNKGTNIVGSVNGLKLFYTGLHIKPRQGASVGSSMGFVVGSLWPGGTVSTHCEEDPAKCVLGILDTVMNAADLPMFLRGAGKFFVKNGGKLGTHGSNLGSSWANTASSHGNFKKLAVFLKNKDNLKLIMSLMSKTSKLSAGVIIPSVAAYLHAAAASDSWAPDMASSNTYYSMVTGMMTAGQLSSLVRAQQKNYRRNKIMKQEANQESITEVPFILKELQEIPLAKNMKVVENFEQNIDGLNVASQSKRSKIKKGHLPNSVVSVAVLRNGAIVAAISTNNAPGLVYYINPKGTKIKNLLDNNSEIGGRPVVASSDLQQNQQIIEAVNDKQRSIREANTQTFHESVQAPLTDVLLQGSDIRFVIYRTQEAVEQISKAMANKGYIGQDTFHRKINGYFVKPLTNRKIQIQKEISDIEDLVSMGNKTHPSEILKIVRRLEEAWGIKIDPEPGKRLNTLTGKKASLQTEYDRLHEYTNKLLKNKVNTDQFWAERFKDFPKKLTLWDVANCGERHAVTAMPRLGIHFYKHLYRQIILCFLLRYFILFYITFIFKNLSCKKSCYVC